MKFRLGMAPVYARIMAAFGAIGFALIDPTLTSGYLDRRLSITLGAVAFMVAFVVAIMGSIAERKSRSETQQDK